MGVISIGIVPMGVFSFGAVAMGIVNLSVVGMGIISAGVTTMGIWEYSPNSQNNHHNHSKQISNSSKENMMSDLFNTKREAERLPQNTDVLEHIKWVINGCLVRCTKYFFGRNLLNINSKSLL